MTNKLVLLLVFLLIGFVHCSYAYAESKTSYTLSESIKLLMDGNVNILKAKEQIKYAEGGLLIHKSDNLPQMTLTGKQEAYDREPFEEDQGYGASIEQNIYRFGEQNVTERKAYRQAKTDFEKTKYDEIYKLKTTFYTIVIKQEQIQERRVFLKEFMKKLRRVKGRHKAGKNLQIDVLNTELQIANEELEINELKRDLIYLKENFLKLIGKPLEIDVDLEGEFIPRTYDIDICVNRALEVRYEISDLDDEVDIQKRIVKEVFWKTFPGLSFSTTYAGKRNEASLSLTKDDNQLKTTLGGERDVLWGQPNSSEDNWNMSLSVTFPLFQGYKLKGTYMKERATLKKLELDLGKKKKEIELEVRKAYNTYLNKKENLEIQKRQMDLKKKRWYILEKLKEIGEANFDDAMDAQEKFIQAEDAYFTGQINLVIAQNTLEKAINVNK